MEQNPRAAQQRDEAPAQHRPCRCTHQAPSPAPGCCSSDRAQPGPVQHYLSSVRLSSSAHTATEGAPGKQVRLEARPGRAGPAVLLSCFPARTRGRWSSRAWTWAQEKRPGLPGLTAAFLGWWEAPQEHRGCLQPRAPTHPHLHTSSHRHVCLRPPAALQTMGPAAAEADSSHSCSVSP